MVSLLLVLAGCASSGVGPSTAVDGWPRALDNELDVSPEIQNGILDYADQVLADAAEEAARLGLRVCAGHGLHYTNTAPIAALDSIEELSIGHAIIARAVFTGLDQAVKEMLAIVRQADFSL